MATDKTNRKMRIIITGSKTWRDQGLVRKTIATVIQHHFFGHEYKPSKKEIEAAFLKTYIVHGNAAGAEAAADKFARESRINVDVFKADWDKYEKSAGPIRNRQMVDSNPKADICLAFISDNDSRGTKSIIKHAKERGIFVLEIPSE